MADSEGGDILTQNQISYAKLREDQRHNLASESQKGIELAEAARHNVATEDVNWYTAREAGRHNLAYESETARHNVAGESLNWYVAPSQVESNYASAGRSDAAAMYDVLRGEDIERRYELDKDKVENDLFVRLRQLGIDESKLDLSREQFNKEAGKIDAYVEDLFYRQGLDWSRYKTEYSSKKAAAFRDYTSGAKNIVEALGDVIDWVAELVTK